MILCSSISIFLNLSERPELEKTHGLVIYICHSNNSEWQTFNLQLNVQAQPGPWPKRGGKEKDE